MKCVLSSAIIAWCICLSAAFLFLESPIRANLPEDNQSSSDPEKPQGAKPTPPAEKKPLTEAERIIRLKNTLAEKTKRLAELEKRFQDPESDYARAEANFKQLDMQWLEKKREIQKLLEAGKQEEADKIMADSQKLFQGWEKARDEFDLAVQEWKTSRSQEATLTKEIDHLRHELEQLKGINPPPAAGSEKNDPMNPGASREPAPEPTPAPAPPGTSEPKSDNGKDSPPAGTKPSTGKSPENKELKQAKQTAQEKEQQAKKAVQKAQSLTQRLEILREQIEQEQKLLEIARKKADLAAEHQLQLSQLLQQKQAENAPKAERAEIAKQLEEAIHQADEARRKVKEMMESLTALQEEKSALLAEQIVAMHDADQTQQEAVQALRKVEELQNPFTTRNILQWLIDHGPKILAIALTILFLNRVILLASHRLVKIMAKRNKSRGEAQGGEDRAHTLVGVFRSAANFALLVGGCLMILEEIGIPIIPLIGGAAVVGLAVAFGAQNLIRDYFTGFMILLEDQYSINDIVKIGEIGGVVEKITLRTTVLRDLGGVVHFLPHGNITTVSNMTHGWSRALIEVGVAYKEDVDRVMDLLMEIGQEMQHDPGYGPFILDAPEMLGVDEFSDSAIVIKLFLKTRPPKRWAVKREMLRRIKKKFDELGIEIPFPHRTVYHRYENDQPGTLLEREPKIHLPEVG